MYNQNTKSVAINVEHGVLAWAETSNEVVEKVIALSDNDVTYNEVADAICYEAYSKKDIRKGFTYVLPCDPRFYDFLVSNVGMNYEDYDLVNGVLTFG